MREIHVNHGVGNILIVFMVRNYHVTSNPYNLGVFLGKKSSPYVQGICKYWDTSLGKKLAHPLTMCCVGDILNVECKTHYHGFQSNAQIH